MSRFGWFMLGALAALAALAGIAYLAWRCETDAAHERWPLRSAPPPEPAPAAG